ncbi:MAG: major outer membrane protein [Campylobacteraceae bacterium]|jgi:hypothetical protein|nr:major outer membrane protein [Campylobacteraceae bacterium]
MKQIKLSLVALVAIGTLSHLSAESSLEETLKKAVENIKISGFTRTKYNISKTDGANTGEVLRLSGQLNVVSKVYDDLFFGTTLAADGNNFPSHDPSSPIAGYTASNNKGLYVDRFYLKYLINDFELIGGKYDITSPWTETGFNSSRGNGLSVLYKGIKDWTFAGLTFLQTNGFDDTNYGVDLGSHHNYYATGVTGSFKDAGLDLQLWTGIYEKTMEVMIYTDVRYSFNGFGIRAQANYAKLDKDFAISNNIESQEGLYYGLELRYNVNDLFYVKGEYTKNDKDQPFYTFDGDNGGFLTSGEYETLNAPNAARYSVSIGKNFNDLRLEGSYYELDRDGDIKKLNGGSVEAGYKYGNFIANLELTYKQRTVANGQKKGIKGAELELIYWF